MSTALATGAKWLRPFMFRQTKKDLISTRTKKISSRIRVAANS